MSVDEIAERLALPKTTVWYWIKDLPLGRPRKITPPASPGQRQGNKAMQLKYQRLREAAYASAREEYAEMAAVPGFTDFICLYLAEGYKRNRNTVSVGNSDPAIVRHCTRWIRHLSSRKVTFSVQYHTDQDLQELQEFWSDLVGVEPKDIKLLRKSNSGQMKGRTWRSVHGVLTVCTNDTLFRARLQAWMDMIRESWTYTDSRHGV